MLEIARIAKTAKIAKIENGNFGFWRQQAGNKAGSMGRNSLSQRGRGDILGILRLHARRMTCDSRFAQDDKGETVWLSTEADGRESCLMSLRKSPHGLRELRDEF